LAGYAPSRPEVLLYMPQAVEIALLPHLQVLQETGVKQV
jgi:hypothetical protein